MIRSDTTPCAESYMDVFSLVALPSLHVDICRLLGEGLLLGAKVQGHM